MDSWLGGTFPYIGPPPAEQGLPHPGPHRVVNSYVTAGRVSLAVPTKGPKRGPRPAGKSPIAIRPLAQPLGFQSGGDPTTVGSLALHQTARRVCCALSFHRCARIKPSRIQILYTSLARPGAYSLRRRDDPLQYPFLVPNHTNSCRSRFSLLISDTPQ
jgi:hypothetical protein